MKLIRRILCVIGQHCDSYRPWHRGVCSICGKENRFRHTYHKERRP